MNKIINSLTVLRGLENDGVFSSLTEYAESVYEGNPSEEKFNEVSRQLSVWAKSNLRPDVYDALASTADGVIALYKMMSSNEPALGKDRDFGSELSEESLRKMMEDPRYWRDKDVSYIAKVTKGFEKLYPGK